MLQLNSLNFYYSMCSVLKSRIGWASGFWLTLFPCYVINFLFFVSGNTNCVKSLEFSVQLQFMSILG